LTYFEETTTQFSYEVSNQWNTIVAWWRCMKQVYCHINRCR